MKTPLNVAKNEIETEAEDHAEETRYAVTHHGRELHPPKSMEGRTGRDTDHPEKPWQID